MVSTLFDQISFSCAFNYILCRKHVSSWPTTKNSSQFKTLILNGIYILLLSSIQSNWSQKLWWKQGEPWCSILIFIKFNLFSLGYFNQTQVLWVGYGLILDAYPELYRGLNMLLPFATTTITSSLGPVISFQFFILLTVAWDDDAYIDIYVVEMKMNKYLPLSLWLWHFHLYEDLVKNVPSKTTLSCIFCLLFSTTCSSSLFILGKPKFYSGIIHSYLSCCAFECSCAGIFFIFQFDIGTVSEFCVIMSDFQRDENILFVTHMQCLSDKHTFMLIKFAKPLRTEGWLSGEPNMSLEYFWKSFV